MQDARKLATRHRLRRCVSRCKDWALHTRLFSIFNTRLLPIAAQAQPPGGDLTMAGVPAERTPAPPAAAEVPLNFTPLASIYAVDVNQNGVIEAIEVRAWARGCGGVLLFRCLRHGPVPAHALCCRWLRCALICFWCTLFKQAPFCPLFPCRLRCGGGQASRVALHTSLGRQPLLCVGACCAGKGLQGQVWGPCMANTLHLSMIDPGLGHQGSL